MTDQLSNPPAQPFAIGLKPLKAEDTFQIDADLPRYRAQKLTLYQRCFDQVCMAQSDTLAAQLEVENLVHTNLQQHHSHLYNFGEATVAPTDGTQNIKCNEDMPIASAALLVQDDLLLMQRTVDGWVLTAASLCFPSSWNLAEKFAKPLENIHKPVPMAEKMTARINRIFDALKPDTPLWRMNWSLENNANLRHEKRQNEPKAPLGKSVFFRSEYQTLHKLPGSGDVLFTVRIHTQPMTDFVDQQEGREKIALLHNQYLKMTDAERDYKGINNVPAFIAWLETEGSNHA